VTGVTGREPPAEAADRAAAAGALLKPLEQKFHGRTVTMPAFHYYEERDEEKLADVCRRLKEEAGFRYVVLVTGTAGLLASRLPADLILQPLPDEPPEQAAQRAVEGVIRLWKGLAATDE
jgi:hypothetical protein